MKIFLLVILSLQSHGSLLETCPENQTPTFVAQRQLLEAAKMFWQGCPGMDSIQQDAAKKSYTQEFPPSMPRISGNVSGLTLTGTQEELELLRGMIGIRPPRSWPASASSCKTVVCAAGKLHGNLEIGLRALVIGKVSGYSLSADQQKNPIGVEQRWSVAEARALSNAIQILPPKFYRLKYLKNLYRVADGYRLLGHTANVAAYSNSQDSTIVFYDRFVSGDVDPIFIILHELVHHYDFDKYENGQLFHRNSGFAELSGWDRGIQARDPKTGQVVEKFSHASDSRFVSEYSGTLPLEDFAEAGAFFLWRPWMLKAADPKKYEFIRDKLFDGKEPTMPVRGLEEFLREGSWVNRTLADCAKKVVQFRREPGGKVKDLYLLTISDAGEDMYMIYQNAEAFLRRCTKDSISDLLGKFQGKDEFCALDGEHFAVDSVLAKEPAFLQLLKKDEASKLQR